MAAKGGNAQLSETLVLNVNTGTIHLKSLQELDALLGSIQQKADAAGRALGRTSARSAKEFQGVLRATGQKSFSVGDLSKVYAEQFGLSDKDLARATKNFEQSFTRHMGTLSARLKNKFKGGVFSGVGAAEFLSSFEKANPSGLGQILGRLPARAAVPAGAVPDMAAFAASLKDTLAAAAASVRTAAGPGGRSGGAARPGKGPATLGPVNPATLETDLLGRVITKTAKGTTTAFTQLKNADTRLTSVLNEKNELLRSVARVNEDASKTLKRNIRNARRDAQRGDRAARSLAEAGAIEGFLGSKDFQGLPAGVRGQLSADLRSQAARLRAQAEETTATRAQREAARVEARERRESARSETLVQRLRRVRAKAEKDYEEQRLRSFRAQSRFESRRPPALPARPSTFLEQAFSRSPGRYGFGGGGDGGGGGPRRSLIPLGGPAGGAANFLGDVVHVGRWAAAVSVAAGSVAVLGAGLKSLVDVGYQTARLDQVFTGIGGTTRQLATDVLGLAAAMGRETQEALDSAIAWARLGLTRVQVNEAVRTSLIAANVAEITAGEATEALSSILAAYKLEVTDLAGVLATLNATSNNYNATVANLLDGLSRAGAVTRQAGLSFAELQGLIAVGVGATGQTGANIGNAIKALTVSLGNPEIQNFLRDRFNLEVASDAQGGLKAESQLLAELKTKYDELSDAERNELIVRVANKTQSSRIVALMDNYTTAMALASNSVKQFSSAEEENARITATLGNSLKGTLGVFYDLINRAGGSAFAEFGAGLNQFRGLAVEALGLLDQLAEGARRQYPGLSRQQQVTGLAGAAAQIFTPGQSVVSRGINAVRLTRQVGGLFPERPAGEPTAAEEAEDRLQALAASRRLAAREAARNAAVLARGGEIDRGQLAKFVLLPDLADDAAEARRQLEAAAAENNAVADRLSAEALQKMTAREERIRERMAQIRGQLRGTDKSGPAAETLNKQFENEVRALDSLAEKRRQLRPDYDAEGQFTTSQARIQEFQRSLLGTRGTSFRAGDSGTDRLLNQRKQLLEDMNRLQSLSARTVGEAVQLAVTRQQLEQNLLETYQRQFAVSQELVELQRNARREQARALVTGGPEDILKQLAAQRLGGSGNINQFLALAPELRGIISANPESPFNFEANQLRREQQQLPAGGLPSLDQFMRELLGDSPEAMLRLATSSDTTAVALQTLGVQVELLAARLSAIGSAPGNPLSFRLPVGVER